MAQLAWGVFVVCFVLPYKLCKTLMDWICQKL